MSVQMQKQTARNLVLSANSQAAYGGILGDGALTYRASVDPSTVFTNPDQRFNDAGAVGHGTDFATVDIRTGWDSNATIKGMGGVDAWLLGWMLAFTFGQEAVTGAGPYRHDYAIPNISSTMPCTTAYIEDTNDIHRKYADMFAKSLSIDIPERSVIQATLEMAGTGRFFPGSFGGALPAIPTPSYLLGSDVAVTISPAGGAVISGIGRQKGLSVKVDRGSAPFESSGDGLHAGSGQSGKLAYSFDLTLMADATDDINALYENATLCSITIATDPTKALQLGFTFPNVRLKASKLGNVEDKVAWQISGDQGTAIQVGNTSAISAFIINNCPAYLIPA